MIKKTNATMFVLFVYRRGGKIMTIIRIGAPRSSIAPGQSEQQRSHDLVGAYVSRHSRRGGSHAEYSSIQWHTMGVSLSRSPQR